MVGVGYAVRLDTSAFNSSVDDALPGQPHPVDTKLLGELVAAGGQFPVDARVAQRFAAPQLA